MSQSSALATVDSRQEDIKLEDHSEVMREMPLDMLVFSTCMRSLYVEKAVGTNYEAARKFRKLRDDTRNDAMVYLKGILPVSQKLVSGIQDIFENYLDLSYKKWAESLWNIVDDVRSYRQICNAVVKMHEDIMVLLKVRKDQAELVMLEMKNRQRKFESIKREFERSAASKKIWAWATALIQSDITKAVANGGKAQIQEAASLALANYLIPALKRFIDGLLKAVAVFSLWVDEFGMFAQKGDKNLHNPKKHHFKMMNKQAQELKSYCQQFMIALPSMRTELHAIPTQGTDHNYVDRWLKTQQAIIQQSCTESTKFIMTAIRSDEALMSTTTTVTISSRRSFSEENFEKLLLRLSPRISVDWKTLGGQLGLQHYELSNINNDFHRTQDKAYEMLMKWRQKYGREATPQVLVAALWGVERNDLSDIVREFAITGS